MATVGAALREIGQPPALATALAAAATAAGVGLGLWSPRRFAGAAPATPLTRGHAAEAALARGLAAGAFVALALAWAALFVTVDLLPAWRRLMLARSVAPQAWLMPFVLLPGLAGAALVGLVGAVAAAALHGWNRAVLGASRGVVRLWLALLAGVLLGALACEVMQPSVGAPVLFSLAAAVAVAWASEASVAPQVSPHYRPPAERSRGALAAAALAAALVGGSAAALPVEGGDAARSEARGVAIAAAGGLVGVALGRWLIARRASGDVASLVGPLVLGAAVCTVAPLGLVMNGAVAAALRLLLTASVATLVVMLAGRRLARAAHSVQYALAALGVTAGAGFAAGSLGTTLALVGLRAERAAPHAALTQQEEFADEVRRLLAANGLRWHTVSELGVGAGERGVDVVSIPAAALGTRAALNGLPRLVEHLAPGGRVVVEYDDAPLSADCAAARRALGELGSLPGVRLEIRRGAQHYHALVFGYDAPAWLAHRPLPREWRVSVSPCSD